MHRNNLCTHEHRHMYHGSYNPPYSRNGIWGEGGGDRELVPFLEWRKNFLLPSGLRVLEVEAVR